LLHLARISFYPHFLNFPPLSHSFFFIGTVCFNLSFFPLLSITALFLPSISYFPIFKPPFYPDSFQTSFPCLYPRRTFSKGDLLTTFGLLYEYSFFCYQSLDTSPTVFFHFFSPPPPSFPILYSTSSPPFSPFFFPVLYDERLCFSYFRLQLSRTGMEPPHEFARL